jgi:hypothetical protein
MMLAVLYDGGTPQGLPLSTEGELARDSHRQLQLSHPAVSTQYAGRQIVIIWLPPGRLGQLTAADFRV